MAEPPTRVRRHASDLGAWEMVDREPAPALRGYVRRYTGYLERTTGPLRRSELPTGDVVLILSFGPSIDLLPPQGGGVSVVRLTSFVAGVDDAYSLTEHAGVQHGVQVDLTPLGAFRFFGIPLHELARRVIPVEDVLGNEAPRLVEQLYAAAGWAERFELLDTAIAARAGGNPQASPDVTWAWRRLTDTAGRLSVGSLTEELRCSRRHLTARFREQVGLPPKTVAQIIRFNRAVRALRRDGGSRLAEIAHGCGYYDQAHFNRDFRRFSGSTPSEFLARQLPAGGGTAGA